MSSITKSFPPIKKILPAEVTVIVTASSDGLMIRYCPVVPAVIVSKSSATPP